jgi:RHS repeat-associated protein
VNTMKIRSIVNLLVASFLVLMWSSTAAAYVIIGGTPPNAAPAPGERYTDLGQGLFEYAHTDFKIAGPIPIVVTRVYRSKDWDSNQNFIVRPFGIGMNLNYNMYLYSQSEAAGTGYTDAEIVLPDGGRVVCNRTSSCTQNGCTDYTDAVFQCTSNPDATFFGAEITYNAGTPGWNVTLKNRKVYSFGRGAPLQSISDRYGNQVTLVRSGGQNGKITQIRSSNGRYINFSYTDSANPNLITEAVDNSGVSFAYGYDSNSRLTSASTLELWHTFSYGSGNQMGDMITLNQAIYYSEYGQVWYTTNIQYGNTASRVSKISTPAGAWTYNPTISGGQIQKLTITDPNGIGQKYFFNSSGYLTEDIKAPATLASTTTYTRDPNTNHILSVTDNIGRVTSYAYDSLGNITSITRLSGTPNAVTTTYTYGACSQLASVTDPLGHSTSATFDSNCDATTVADPTGNTYMLQYNAAPGLLTAVTDPLNNTTQLGYDSASDLASIADPLNNTSKLSYDALGRLTGTTDPLSNSTGFYYDYSNDLAGVTDANGKTTQFPYDDLQDFLGWTDADGHSTSINYDTSVGAIEMCSGAGGCATYYVDALGNVTSYTDKRGLTTTYTYDKLYRLTEVQYNSSKNTSFPQTTVTYSYDGANRVTQMVDTGGGSPSSPGNTQTFVHDGLDRVTSWTSPEGTVNYTYDQAGRRLTMKAGGQAQINYCYDTANRLLTLTSGGAYQCPSPNPTVTIAYDQGGRRQSLALPNGVSVAYGYDADSHISSLNYLSAGGVPLGNLAYSYDADSRVVGVSGSLAAVNLPAAVNSATYNAGNQLSVWNGTSIPSDQANNLSTDPTVPVGITWDERNHAASVNSQGGQNFLYDFRYDAVGRRESEYGSIPTATFLYDGFTPVRTTTGSANADLLAMPGTGEVFARTDSSGTMVPLHDGLGSTVALVNSAGAIATQYTYQPFGKSTVTGAANANPFQFAGMEHDSTGLYHTWARYYSPGLQRFLSEDPLGIGGGDTNIFAYVHNDPVNMFDPLGLSGGAGGASSGAAGNIGSISDYINQGGDASAAAASDSGSSTGTSGGGETGEAFVPGGSGGCGNCGGVGIGGVGIMEPHAQPNTGSGGLVNRPQGPNFGYGTAKILNGAIFLGLSAGNAYINSKLAPNSTQPGLIPADRAADSFVNFLQNFPGGSVGTPTPTPPLSPDVP